MYSFADNSSSCAQIVELDGERLKLQLWDTAGQERFKRSITHHYYRNVSAVVFVYDVTSVASLVALDSWLEEVRNHGVPDSASRVLVGNKCDQVARLHFSLWPFSLCTYYFPKHVQVMVADSKALEGTIFVLGRPSSDH